MANIKSSGNKPQIDIEKVRYCDNITAADGTVTKVEFLRCFVYKNGVLDADATKDYEDDGTTPYVVQGDVTRCIEDVADQCDLIDVWICDNATGVQGVTEEIWVASAVGTGSSHPITDGFTQLDDCGLLAHENAPDTVQVNTSFESTNINNPPAGGGTDQSPDQHTLFAYVKLPEQVSLHLRSGGVHAGAAAFGPCIGKMKESFQYNGTADGNAQSIGFVGPGIVQVKTWLTDPTQNGNHRLRFSTDGGTTLQDVPDEWVFTTPPKVEGIKAYYNKTDCKYYRADDKTEIVESDDLQVLCYNPCTPQIEVLTTPATPVKDVVDVEQVVLCDKALTGEITKFIRNYKFIDGVADGFFDTLLDGTAYTPSGIVSDCEKKCGDTCAYWNGTVQVAAGAIGDITALLNDANGNGDYCEATCAKISIIQGNGTFTYHEGGEPNSDLASGDYVGHPVFECDIIELGCCGCAGGDKGELKDFKITPAPGETLTFSVTLSRPK